MINITISVAMDDQAWTGGNVKRKSVALEHEIESETRPRQQTLSGLNRELVGP